MSRLSRWVRLYVDVPDNPKVQSLAPELFRFWVNCLCLAGRSDEGLLPSLEHMAWTLRMQPQKVSQLIEALVSESWWIVLETISRCITGRSGSLNPMFQLSE